MATAKQKRSTTVGATAEKSAVVKATPRAKAKPLAESALRQIATPRAGLYLQVSAKKPVRTAALDQRAATLLTQMSGTLSRPGVDRARVFGDKTKGVYAYSVDPKDPTRIVREDATGRSRAGKFVNGSFRLATIRKIGQP